MDALYMAYLARLLWGVPGPIAGLGYLTAGRLFLLLPASCLFVVPSDAGPPTGLELIAWIISMVLLPACMFIWPAVYAWMWASKVEGLS